MSLKRWELIGSKDEYKNKFFSVEKRTYKLPNGKKVDDYYHITKTNFVLIVATNSEGKILIEKTYRRGIDDFVVELPAGYIDEGETPLEAGMRELLEETGYKGQAEFLGEIYIQPGYLNQKAYVVKIMINKENAQKPKLDDDEFIELEFLPMTEVDKLIAENKVKDMGMLSALAIYDRINI